MELVLHYFIGQIQGGVGIRMPDWRFQPEAALAFSNSRPGQSHETWLGSNLAWPRPRFLYVKCKKMCYRSVCVQESYSEQYMSSSSSSSVNSPSHKNSSTSDLSSEPTKFLPVLKFSWSLSVVSSPSNIEDVEGS
jgi:hypothetical protein